MSHTTQTPRRTWPWVVLVVVVVAAIIVAISVVSTVLAGQSATAPATTAPPTVTASATPTRTPSSTATSVSKPHDTLTTKDVAKIEGAVEDSDAAELYSELSSPVHVQFAASDFDSDRSRDNTVTDLDYINGLSGWNWKPDAATLAAFRAGAYGDSFPQGAIVGQSTEGYVISFTITKAKISSIFVSKSLALVTAAKQ